MRAILATAAQIVGALVAVLGGFIAGTGPGLVVSGLLVALVGYLTAGEA